MPINRGHLYIIDFNPRIKTKPGKLRPALVLQSDLINEANYPSTIVIPTTNDSHPNHHPACRKCRNSSVSAEKRAGAALRAIAISSWPSNRCGQRILPARDWHSAKYGDRGTGKSYPYHPKPVMLGFVTVSIPVLPITPYTYTFHLMTLFARSSTLTGIVRSICFAALRLITNSNFVACCTGKSAGLAPFKILST